MTDRFPYRKLETVSRDYIVERVNDNGRNHFELTTINAITGEVLESGVIFNTKRDADKGLLDRAGVR
jgi:hypothetical protein